MSFDSSQPAPAPNNPNDGTPAVRARVPDHVADGCFSSGAIVMTGPSEFIVDFLQTVGRPHRVAKRVIVPHAVMPQFVDALQTNLELYKNRFGDPPQPPAPNPPPERRPTPQEIYDDLKLPDEVLSGVYANGVMIGHGASEFGLDFMTSFFPQSAVSARVFLAAGQVPRLLDSLRGAVQQLQQRQQAIQGGGQIQVSAGGPQLPVTPKPDKTDDEGINPASSGQSDASPDAGEIEPPNSGSTSQASPHPDSSNPTPSTEDSPQVEPEQASNPLKETGSIDSQAKDLNESHDDNPADDLPPNEDEPN